ncbi:unnamed protein product [Eruca vesicaria subsp. sativa]|uniref:F-box domain-containing protein n=1 Tax=Eruca vesicaria subsp. sativa TaxID=29727 RepID=A0ABC8JAT4_ERUVS|nr:unnamed protein product [Eruca vesicaria subsp. sativa]
MVWKVNANQARSALKKDEISQLPNDVTCQIISLLSTKEAVKTSVLSTRWRHIWLSLPCLELKSREFSDLENFMSFGDRFFDSSRVSSIQKVKLTIDKKDVDGDDSYCLASWFDAAAKCKIQNLHVSSYSYADRKFNKMPQRLYNCETLVCLKLFQVALSDAEIVSLPCLKKMYLEYIDFPNEATFETLVLCSPVLECLKIVVSSDDEKVFRVQSRSLKKLTFERTFSLISDSAGVVIDCPRLDILNINDNVSKGFIIHNLGCNAVLQMNLLGMVRWEEFDDELDNGIYEEGVSWNRSNIHRFIHGISMVRSIKISRGTFKVCDGRNGFPRENVDQVSFSSVPECLLSSLEFVDFIATVQYDVEIKLVKYLVKNSAVLKKLTLRLASDSRRDEMLKKLLKTPRASTKCKVFIL